MQFSHLLFIYNEKPSLIVIHSFYYPIESSPQKAAVTEWLKSLPSVVGGVRSKPAFSSAEIWSINKYTGYDVSYITPSKQNFFLIYGGVGLRSAFLWLAISVLSSFRPAGNLADFAVTGPTKRQPRDQLSSGGPQSFRMDMATWYCDVSTRISKRHSSDCFSIALCLLG